MFVWAVWLASLAVRFFYVANHASNADDGQMWLGLVWTFVVVAAISAILAQFYRWSPRSILTGRRVVLKNGILQQRYTERI